MEPEHTPELVQRFIASMSLDFERWHDGIGYDLEVLGRLSPEDKTEIARRLALRDPLDWRDIEALAALDTMPARETLRQMGRAKSPQVKLWIARYAPECLDSQERTHALIGSLGSATIFSGLSEALDQVAEFHPPEVIEALFRGALHRDGESAVHFAAMLMYVHGQAAEPFDWELRTFFLTFHTEPGPLREPPFIELCRRLNVDPRTWLGR